MTETITFSEQAAVDSPELSGVGLPGSRCTRR